LQLDRARMLAPSVPGGGSFTDGVAVITLFTEQGCALRHGLQQRLCFLAVVDLSTGQLEREGTTVSVIEGMDLAREAARERPMPRSSDPPYCPSHRAGARGHRLNRSSRSRLRRWRKPQPAVDPTPRLCASGRTGCSRSSRDRSARGMSANGEQLRNRLRIPVSTRRSSTRGTPSQVSL